MQYVQPLSTENAPEKSKPILKAVKDKFGQSLNLFNTLAHQPDVLGGVVQLSDGIHNDLPDALRELAYFKASQINHCEYCSHYHSQAAKKAGVSDQQIDEVDNYTQSDAFNDLEKAVLSYSEQLTKTAEVDDATVSKLKESLNEKQFVSLAATVALANFTNRVNHGLGIELP